MAAGAGYSGGTRKKKRKTYPRPKRESGGGPYVPLPKFKAPKAPGSGGTGGLPGGIPAATTVTPNIDQILAKDPFYQATHAQYSAESVADQASRDASIKRAIIDFGGNPSGTVDPAIAGVIDPTTLALADKNTASGMSILARLAAAAKDQSAGVVDSLAARGTFNTGFTGQGLQRANLQAGQANYDATKNLLDYLAGVQAAYVQSERDRIAKENEAKQGAVQSWDGSVSPAGLSTPGLVSNPGWVAQTPTPPNSGYDPNSPKPGVEQVKKKAPAKKKPPKKPSPYGV